MGDKNKEGKEQQKCVNEDDFAVIRVERETMRKNTTIPSPSFKRL